MISHQLSREPKKPLSPHFPIRVMNRISGPVPPNRQRWLLRAYWLLAAMVVLGLCGPAALALSGGSLALFFLLLDPAPRRRHLRILGVEPRER